MIGYFIPNSESRGFSPLKDYSKPNIRLKVKMAVCKRLERGFERDANFPVLNQMVFDMLDSRKLGWRLQSHSCFYFQCTSRGCPVNEI